MADQLAKAATKEEPVAAWKEKREEQRRVKGTGMGRVIKWNKKARVTYV